MGEEDKRARTKGGAKGREFLWNNEEVGLKRRGEEEEREESFLKRKRWMGGRRESPISRAVALLESCGQRTPARVGCPPTL